MGARRRCRGVSDVEAAFAAAEPVRLLVVDETARGDAVARLVERAGAQAIPVRRVSARALRRMGGPGGPVEALALVGPDPRATLAEACRHAGAMWLLVGTEYPGNAGLATRTAEVSGAAGVCIDAPFDAAGRKACLRASMRADRLMPVHFVAAGEAVAAARDAGRCIVVVEDVGDRAPWEVDLTRPSLFVIGGEAEGVPRAIVAEAEACIRIPTPGFVSSYNVQAAMAIVAGEQLRQLASERPRSTGREPSADW